MMLQSSPEPRPLTRTNVTRHDKIWEKENQCNFFGFNTTDAAFSPPLKHITPDTAKELWENFDPLDVLGSGSDSSCDTMVMMNTEEERKNEASIQRSNQSYEHRKLQHEKSYNYGLNGLKTLRTPEEEDVTLDEGYGTDNRTNTTASISSPLSSSLSSLSTSESTSSQGSITKVNVPMSRSQQVTSNGRFTSNTRPIMPVRKVTKNVDYPESSQSLEERLRALTTIEEEDSNCNSDQEKPTRPQSYNRGSRFTDNQPRPSLNAPIRNRQTTSNGPVSNSNASDHDGVFHAVPVQVGQQGRKPCSQFCNYETTDNMPTSPTSRQEWINHVEKLGYVPHSDVKYYDTLWNDKNIQMGMSEKCGDGKRIPVLNEDVDSDLIIKQNQRTGSHMVSMPDLRIDKQYNPPVIYANDTPVKMRQKPTSTRDRYSWDYNNLAAQTELANTQACDSPRLQDQLRAMSELSLGVKKPLYASSADIYKLFQGQGQYGLPQGRNASHRHSFHAMPSSQSWLQPSPQSTEEVKMRLRSASTSSKVPSIPPKKPLRINYEQLNFNETNIPVRDTPSFLNGGQTAPYQSGANKKESKLSTLV